MTTGARHVRAGRPVVHTRFTDRRDGDLCVGLPDDVLEPRRASVAPTPWTWLDQVHGADVVVVTGPGEHAGASADAAVTDVVGATLAVHTADCAGVLMHAIAGDRIVIGAAHAGWRGLELGVLGATVDAMRSLGAGTVRWRLGPCIGPAAYEFGRPDLDRLVEQFGDVVASTTADGAPALDLRAGVAAALAAVDALPDVEDPMAVRCTATDPDCFSWRARADRGRQAAVIWTTAA